MLYRLATYRECKAHREWNTTCPSCGRRGKFSPYIDTTTMRPVDDRQCGRCNRLSNCGYHLPPRMLARTEDFGSRRSREKRESPGPVNYASHRSHKSHRSCIAEGSQLPSGWIKQQAALLGEAEASFVATDAHSRRRRSRQQGRSDLPFREIREICVRQKEEFGETKAETAMPAAPSLCGRAGGEATAFYEKMRRACEQSQPWGSHLVTWLRTQFPRDAVAAALKRYRVGGTPDGATLWWQIDTQGRVHTGKAMQYNPLTGHRVKESGPPLIPPRGEDRGASTPPPRGRVGGGSSPVNWAHRMRLYGEPSDLVVPQCLFGEHLVNVDVNVNADAKRASVATTEALALQRSGACDLNCHPEDIHREAQSSFSSSLSLNVNDNCHPEDIHREAQSSFSSSLSLALQAATPPLVMLVESEKTALIMSLVCPDRVWLATGGKANFKEQMLAPLIGLEVAVYPDADALRDWYARAVEMNRTLGTRLYIPTWYYNLMDHPEAIARGLDLADVLVGFRVL